MIIPNVLGAARLAGEADDDYHSRVFGEYVQQVVFDPAGVSSAQTAPPASPNLYYAWPDGGLAGVGGATDFTPTYGAFGWYLSVMELGAFLATLRYTEDIISASSRLVMDSEELGYWNTRVGENGTYRMKQGGWVYTSGPARTASTWPPSCAMPSTMRSWTPAISRRSVRARRGARLRGSALCGMSSRPCGDVPPQARPPRDERHGEQRDSRHR